jgi:hypothetical protein
MVDVCDPVRIAMGSYAIGFWQPTILRESGVKDPFHIGLLTMLPYTLALISMILVGRHSDKMRERRWHLVIPNILAALGFVLCTQAGSNMIDLEAFDQLGRDIPVLLNLKPSGTHYMEHFHHAGGLPALMRELTAFLDLDALSISGGTIGDAIAQAEVVPGQDVIRSLATPLKKEGAMAVLHGNLAPQSAVIKQSAASPKLMHHTGRAVVFDSVEDMTTRIDLPDLNVTPMTFWFCATPGQREHQACRRQAICRSQ